MNPKRWTATLLAVPLALTVLAMPSAAHAKAPKPVVYKNCTAVHARYPGGIAKVGAKDKRTGKPKGKGKAKPYVNTALYNANKKMDRDHDGIACEQ